MKNSLKVLLTDDDDGHAKLIRMNLIKSGLQAEIEHFRSGNDLVDYLQGGNVQDFRHYLILLDLNMPGLDGTGVLKIVKSDNRIKNIPVIVLTTASNEKEINKCYELGCNMYATKSTDYSQFASNIQNLGVMIQYMRCPVKRVL